MEVLIGGFPCQDVSTVGKGAGPAPGTRSGLWWHMATALDALQPELVVIENVRGLLSTPATAPPWKEQPAMHAIKTKQPASVQIAVRNLEPDPHSPHFGQAVSHDEDGVPSSL